MKHKFLTGAFSLIAVGLGLSGCSSDDLMSDISTPVEKDTSFYINVPIASPTENSTRANDNSSAEDYENGTEDEQKIHKILFVFYNSSYQYVGNTVITPPAGQETITGDPIKNPGETDGKPGSIENIVTITVPVDVPAGSLKPAYVMAYINPTVGTTDQQRSFVQTLGLTRTLDQMRPSGTGNNEHKGYTMTNSVYYENENASAPAIAVPISEDQLCTKEEDADAAVIDNTSEENKDKKKKVIIYVERVVAKVNLKQTLTGGSLTQENNEISSDGESPVKYTLDFEVLGWGLSNLEKGTFLVKNFRTTSSGNCSNFENPFTLTNMSYSDANAQFSDLKSPKWNMPSSTQTGDYWNISGHRSFWAMSPTYFTGGIYPSYADQTKEEGYNSSLEYITFNDIYNTALDNPTWGAKGKEVKGDGTATTIYTLENTAQAEVVTNHQKRAVTCALIVGKYTIKDAEGKEYNNTTGSKDFFIRQGLDASGKNVQLLYPDETEMKKAFLAQNNTIYLQTDNGENTTPRYTYTPVRGTESHGDEDNPYLKDFQIYHPEKTITDGNYTPNRFVTLKLEKAEGSVNKYYYIDSNGEYAEIDNTSIGIVNAALYHNLNGVMQGVEKYKSGYAYFSVPIKHLWTKKSDGDDIPGIGEDGFTSATLGLYGIVRNHTYTINVQGISGIGTGIGDPSVPIIPTVETDKYFVRTEMRVQRWRVVPQQNVILRP